MYSAEQIKTATDMYFINLLTQEQICERLGYPSQASLSRWIRTDPRYGIMHVRHPENDKPQEPQVKYPFEVRAEAVRLAEEEYLTRREISDRLGLCGAPMVTKWVTIARREGLEALMPRETKRRIGQAAAGDCDPSDDVEELRRQNAALRMENAILEETIKVIKKDPGVDRSDLSNREKTLMVDALRKSYPLSDLLERFGLPRSSFYYHLAAAAAGDKYADLRGRVADIFHEANDARGYRYVHAKLRQGDDPVVVSEKVVRRIMSEGGLEVVYAKKRKRGWSSYAGEVSEAPENIVGRDFHAGKPNELWLTDITEFKIPAGKVYLSPILDCFDGKLVSWSIGEHPTAKLANSSLIGACKTLKEGERPVSHSDRGGHYRWPGWIGICEKYGLVRSMSKKGCSPDNSACEGLFGRIKNEFFYYRDWDGVPIGDFIAMLDAYLRYYNEERIKESLGWMSPVQYRKSLGLPA